MRKLHRCDVMQLGAAATASAVLSRSVFAQATLSLVIGEARATGQSASFRSGYMAAISRSRTSMFPSGRSTPALEWDQL
jgi:hypothetical protein